MARVMEATAVISAHDRTGNTFSNIAAKMRRLQGAAAQINRQGAAIDRVSAATGRGGAAIAAAANRILLPAGAAYAGTRAFKRYADTEMAITRIGITADATDEQIAGLHKTLRNLALETGKPFDEVAEGLSQLVAGGQDLPQAMPAMPAITRTAQAAGAEVRDIANSSLALSQALGVSAERMQEAFDIMVAGGKAGKFELKDMARYLPSIAPQAAAVGMKGEAGLKRIVAMLQAIRNGTGTVEEAASSAANIFAKMESEETSKRFSKFGIDLRKEMAKARTEGRDLLEVFTDLTSRAVGGDLSKIPQIFSDMEFARGMRALLAYRDLMNEVLGKLDNAKGSTARDFERVTSRSQVAVARLAESWDRATESFGRLIEAIGGSKGVKFLGDRIEELADRLDKRGQNEPKTIDEFRDRYTDAKERKRLETIDGDIALAERDVAASEATAKLRKGIGRDPTQAKEKLARLRTEREMLRLNIAARSLELPKEGPHIPASTDGRRLPAHRLDADLREYFGVKPKDEIPMPPADPRRWPPVAPLDAPAIDAKAIADAIASTRNSAPVEATLKGGADINVKVTVEPAPDFWARVKSVVSGVFGNIRVNGGAPTGTTGGTGQSMPEIGMHP